MGKDLGAMATQQIVQPCWFTNAVGKHIAAANSLSLRRSLAAVEGSTPIESKTPQIDSRFRVPKSVFPGVMDLL